MPSWFGLGWIEAGEMPYSMRAAWPEKRGESRTVTIRDCTSKKG